MIAHRASSAATAVKAWPRPAWKRGRARAGAVPAVRRWCRARRRRESPPICRNVLWVAEASPVGRRRRGDRELLIGEFISPAPSPISANRHPAYRRPAGRAQRQRQRPGRRQPQPRDHDRGAREPGRQPPGDRAQDRHQDRHRQERQSRPQRRVVLVLLQVDAVEVQDPVQHDEVGQRGQVRPDEAAAAPQLQRHQRLPALAGRPPLAGDETGRRRHGDDERPDDQRRPPAQGRGLDQAVHQGRQRQHRQSGPGQVGRRRPAPGARTGTARSPAGRARR